MNDPQRLGEYEIVNRLAAGGMATLYLARRADGSSAAPIAIKLVHDHLASDWEAMRWFIDEAMITVRIRHPNVVRVDELGEQDGQYFLVMEYVYGASLADLLAALGRGGKRLDPWLSGWIVSQVAHGLHAAHELRGDEGEHLGLIHRDISPQNILISHSGEVKLADFGIAKAKGRAQRTQSGELRGKFRYMAPEQLTRDAQDRRVDIFALGVVLWELLTQRRLHAGLAPQDLLAAVRDPQVERPSRIKPDVPPGLEGAVLNAVASAPEERPQTAAVLAGDLDDVLQNAPAGFDGRAALSRLMRATLGGRLRESLTSIPPGMIDAAGLASLPQALDEAASAHLVDGGERGHRFGDSGEISPAALAEVGGRTALDLGPAARAARELVQKDPAPPPPPKGGSLAMWAFTLAAALVGFAVAAFFLLRD